MGKKDKWVDRYIEKSAEFARPILKHLRALVHEACPEVAETIKWNMPWFEHQGLLCGMAAFKKHATFGLWKHKLIVTKNVEEGGHGPVRPNHLIARVALRQNIAGPGIPGLSLV